MNRSCASFTAKDLFKGKELGTFEHGFWAEVDESSMLLLSVRCAAVTAE